MRLVGNNASWRQLFSELPSAAILSGPDGVGKRTGALTIAKKVSGGDSFCRDVFDLQAATDMAAWARRSGGRKIAVIPASTANRHSWAVLLRILEELPVKTHVWVIEDASIPAPVKSRCSYILFDRLDPDGVKTAALTSGLIDSNDFALLPSKSFTSFSDLQDESRQIEKVSLVNAWIEGVERGSREEVFDAVYGWNADASRLLARDLEQQYLGKSLLGRKLTRVRKDVLLRGIGELACSNTPKVTALVVGAYLIDSS
jgi:hypothetical protein